MAVPLLLLKGQAEMEINLDSVQTFVVKDDATIVYNLCIMRTTSRSNLIVSS